MGFKIFKEWAFVNYCFQRIGMWDKDDLNDGVNHAFKIQITNLLLPFISVPYIYFNAPKGLFTYLFLASFVFLSFYLCKRILTKKIISLSLEERYLRTKRVTRILNFIFGLLITILCIIYFISSFWLIGFLKE
jgi:hypothetical protein